MKAFIRTVGDIEHHDVVNSVIFADKSRDKYPRRGVKHALITLEKATEAYLVEVLAKSHC